MTDPFSLEDLFCTETDSLSFDDLEATDTDDLDLQIDFDNLEVGGSELLIGLIPMQSEDVLFKLFEKEIEFMPKSGFLQRLKGRELDLYANREEAVDWIYKAHAHCGFGASSACLAINYLDRFLSNYDVENDNNWSVQLLALACLSIAAKMEEISVPPIADMQVAAYPKLCSETITLKNMELLMLRTLKWRMQACTPFSFIDYFLRKIKSEDMLPSESLMYGSLIYKSSQFIINTMKGIDFFQFRPSEISAAVAICVTGETHELAFDKAISGVMHFEKFKLLKCVEMIKALTSITESTDVATGSVTVARPFPQSPNVVFDVVAIARPLPQSPIGVLDATCLSYTSDEITSVSGPSSSQTSDDIKRRRLD